MLSTAALLQFQLLCMCVLWLILPQCDARVSLEAITRTEHVEKAQKCQYVGVCMC